MLDVNAGHPARRRAGDPAPDDRARPVDHRRAALDRLVDRRGARGRALGLPGQGARQLRHRRGRADGARAAARREVRRRGRRDLERRDGHLRGSRRALRGGEEDRLARRRLRHPEGGHRRRPARDADRRDGHRRPAGVPARAPAAGRARRQLDVWRLERQLRPPEPAGAERGLPADGDRVRPDLGDHEPAAPRGAACDLGGRRDERERRALRHLDRPQRRLGRGGADRPPRRPRGHGGGRRAERATRQ